MYQVGQVPNHVHRCYKEHNRWMYVAPVRRAFTLTDFMNGAALVLAFGTCIFAAALLLVLPLI